MNEWMIPLTILSVTCAVLALGVAAYHATHFEKSQHKGNDQNVGL